MADSSFVALQRKARRHLARRDPVLKALIAAVGDCTLEPAGGDSFVVLVRSVVSQLISTAAARTISGRILAAAGPEGITPATLLALGEEKLRQQGVSGAKARTILDLAARTRDGTLPLADFSGLDDERVIAHLTAVRGIGTWTAEMFLIFCLGRPDVLPVGDLGLRAAVQEHFQLAALPGKVELRQLAEPWRPYRSIATWYLWRSRGGVPQSK
jgi:DNA-3-methyladenine glycosylase II